MANEDVSAQQSQRLGKLAANPALSQDQRKSLITTQARMPKQADVEGAITQATSQQALGSFKRGGKVKRSGLYKLHKNETVKRAGKSRSKRA